MSDAKQIKELLCTRIGELAPYLYPNGKREGVHWCVGDINGSPGKSFKICVAGEKAGLWGDFADSQKHSRNLLDLWMQARNVDFKTALHEAAQWAGQPLSRSKPRAEAPASTAKAEPTKAPVTPRPLSELLDAAEGFLRKYVVFQYPEQALVCALWAIFTWVAEAFDFTPYLHVFSAEKRSGKSRLLDVLELLVKAPWRDSGATEAVLFRKIERDKPTLLSDEIDTVFHAKANDGMQNIRRMFNLGFTRGNKVSRCVGQNTNYEIQEFDPFCPKVLCGIGRCLPDTVADRALPIELVRQSSDEKAERFRVREARELVAGIRAELQTWAGPDLIDTLKAARPQMPTEIRDRQEEICEPLIAIADLAGGKWAESARAALVKLCANEEDASIGVKLLAAIKSVFDKADADKLPTKDILGALVATEDDAPWALWWADALNYGKIQVAASKLAKLLKKYGINRQTIRLGDETQKGYVRADFAEAWKRYLPSSSGKGVTRVTWVTSEETNVTADCSVTPTAETEVTRFPLARSENVTAVTAVTAVREGEGQKDLDAMSDAEFEAWFSRTKTVYPGDWLRFRDAADFRDFYGDQCPPLPETCIGLGDSPVRDDLDAVLDTLSCASKWNPSKHPDCFYYHRTRQVARCRDCQDAEWWALGFEVVDGFPWGPWDATPEARIREQDERAQQKLARWEKQQQARLIAEAAKLFNAVPSGERVAEC